MSVLTISREFGSGGREIGLRVAESLQYEFVDRERLLDDIRAAGEKWEKWGQELDEHCPTVWEKYDWSFRGFGALLQSAILRHALNDKVVIIGRGGNFLLQGIPHVLSVHCHAPAASRIETVMRRENVDARTARWMIEKYDGKEPASFVLCTGSNGMLPTATTWLWIRAEPGLTR